MNIEKFDAIVVGAGQAGPALCEVLSAKNVKTAMIERSHFGGTCVNYGCIPTKTLVASARAIFMAKRGEEFGFTHSSFKVDMKKIKARKDRIMLASRQGVESWISNQKNVQVIRGEASFYDAKTLQVNDRLISADKIFLNVGGTSFIPPIPGLKDVNYLDNKSIMDLGEVPEHLIILGGSYIGLEFAQMMCRFGAKVTVIERSERLLPREDLDVSIEVRKILEEEGIQFLMGATAQSVSESNNLKNVRVVLHSGEAVDLSGSHLLVAVGRVPNTKELKLDKVGINTDERGYIRVDDECRTSLPHVWAMGDCNGKGAFTHTSWNDYEIVSSNLFTNEKRKISDRITCYSLFIDPPLARIGLGEDEIRKLNKKDILGAKMHMSRVGRAREASETKGFLKVFVSAESKQILGATILGYNGDEVIHSLLDIMSAKQPYTSIMKTVHIHPTVSELIPTLLQQLRPLE